MLPGSVTLNNWDTLSGEDFFRFGYLADLEKTTGHWLKAIFNYFDNKINNDDFLNFSVTIPHEGRKSGGQRISAHAEHIGIANGAQKNLPTLHLTAFTRRNPSYTTGSY